MNKVDAPEVRVWTRDLDPERALRMYDTFTRYLAYENTIMWTRAQHFLVAHSALLALFGLVAFGKVSAESIDQTAFASAAAFVVCVLGICLSILWHRALISGEFWSAHWQDILRELEPTALGPIPAFRKFDSGRPFVRAVGVARQCAWLFTAVWIIGGGILVRARWQ